MFSENFKSGIEKALSQKSNSSVIIKSFDSLSGGSINNAYRLQTSGGVFFLKWNDSKKYPQMFEAEVKGLSLLRSANALKIPEVILSGDAEDKSFLILEYIEAGSKRKDFWVDFGRKLANLHQHSSASFGHEHDNYIGSLPQSNKQHKSWIEFFIEERLQKQIAFAKDSGAIDNSTVQQFNNLFNYLPEIIPIEKPSLLHGDLWNGNYLVSQEGACLIDPAVYCGHREMDLAMTRLFGGFNKEFYDAYDEEFPLSPGFEARVDVHNLYPLMVHVNLFGGGYLSQVEAVLAKF